MAANPEPHRATGYDVTAEPRSTRRRGDRAGHWTVAFVEGRAPEPVAPTRTCRECREDQPAGAIMHSVAPDIRRECCGSCAGKINRARMEGRA